MLYSIQRGVKWLKTCIGERNSAVEFFLVKVFCGLREKQRIRIKGADTKGRRRAESARRPNRRCAAALGYFLL